MFGFGRKKRREFGGKVDNILVHQLGIDTDNGTNNKFPGLLVYLGDVDHAFYNKHSAEVTAVSIAMGYWAGILNHQSHGGYEEAVNLKPRIIELVDAFALVGAIPLETQSLVKRRIKEYSEKYSL